ncbi:hypothetical protein MKZ38_000748 [Zalerion maritima]|uniref:Uncharacterized protein n=1 Tax=Zalerion maritima TaxID=339359 RepID=A0AAD5RSP0_9PEZI|nr:hypothetical protein MKZ38_000748 [Zalerion maritima]
MSGRTSIPSSDITSPLGVCRDIRDVGPSPNILSDFSNIYRLAPATTKLDNFVLRRRRNFALMFWRKLPALDNTNTSQIFKYEKHTVAAGSTYRMVDMGGMDGLDGTDSSSSSSGLDTSYLVVPYNSGGNDSETIVHGIPFNLTTLEHWNYTMYQNDTISNVSKCYLVFQPYTPDYVFPNGSWTNATSCYRAINGIGPRAGVGLGFVVALGVCLIMCTVNLTRLGRQFLPTQKRFAPVGRRWQWYWSIAACACGMVSLITNIDVDRYYLPQIPIILNVFFWYLMTMAVMSSVWEAVRHWGSWKEREIVDPDNTILRQDDVREKVEFYLPLIFYMWWWLNFFMIIPRSWTRLERQRYPGQAELGAKPMTEDSRFKAAGFLLLVAWITICISLAHSIYHYIVKRPSPDGQSRGIIGSMPLRFILTLPVALCLVSYQILCSFDFDVSPERIGTNVVAMYVGGYAPTLIIIILHNAFGFLSDNEDKKIMAQRRQRGEAWDREQGRAPKPSWWELVKFGNVAGMTVEQRLTRYAQEVRPNRRPHDVEVPTSMQGQIPLQQQQPLNTEQQQQSPRRADEPPPPYTPASPITAAGLVMQPLSPQARPQVTARNTGTTTSDAGGNSINEPPRQVRSMLDV